MPSPYDAWEAMYFLERSAREDHKSGAVEGKTSFLSSISAPSAASPDLAPEEDIRTSPRTSAARVEDLLIVVTNEESSFTSPAGGLGTCLESFAEISNFDQPISPTSIDSDDNEILKQRQVSLPSFSLASDKNDPQVIETLSSFLREKGYDIDEILQSKAQKTSTMTNPLFEEDD